MSASSNMMRATSETGTAYIFRFHPCVSGVHVAQSLVCCVMFCRSLFVLFLLAIVSVLLRFKASD